MTFGRALLAMIGPALLIGPLLGAIGAAALLLRLSMAEGAPGDGDPVLLILAIAMVLGLVLASPLALLFGAIGLVLASRDRRWKASRRWIVTGAVSGVVMGGGYVASVSDLVTDQDVALLASFAGPGAALGAVGGWLARRMLASRLARFARSEDALA